MFGVRWRARQTHTNVSYNLWSPQATHLYEDIAPTAPEGYTAADVLVTAHRLRVAAGAPFIHDEHLADAIAELTGRKAISLTGAELPKAEEAKSASTKEKEGEVELEIG